MTSGDIDRALFRHFHNYEYKLLNTFVFGGWECDFFAQSTSGYFIEVEIKVSRSDFFVDFKKDKHDIFKALHDKKKILVRKCSYGRGGGDIVVKNFSYDKLELQGYRPRSYGYTGEEVNGWNELVEYGYGPGTKRYIVNDWDFKRVYLRRTSPKDLRAPATRIEYIELETREYPNQYWFAVPTGLVKPEEVPGYAGLIYVDDEKKPTLIRKAPFLHKRKMNLNHTLLKKYYNLWKYHLSIDRQIEILNEKQDEITENDNNHE